VTAPDKKKPAWGMKRHMITGFATVAVLVLGLGAWSTLTSIAGAVVGMGVVEVETKRQVVQHATGGVVGKILVKEGQKVKAGETLLLFDDTFDRAELGVIESQLYPLLGTRARLIAEQDDAAEPVFDPELVERAKTSPTEAEIIRSQRDLLVARRATRDKQIEQLNERKRQVQEQNDGMDARIKALEQQLALIRGDLEGQRSLLGQGLTQKSRVTALERDEAQALGSIEEARSSIAENKARIAEIEFAIINVGAQMREEAIKTLGENDGKIAELRERRNSTLATLSRIEVTAPVEGIVYSLQVHAVRSVVRAAEPIMYIVPDNVKLVISVQIPPSQIDQVHIGQDAVVRIDAFDRRHTPDLKGKVKLVSADIITNERTGQSFYVGTVELLPGEEHFLLGKEIRPGMPAEVFIRTTERTPFDYLVRPLTSYFGKAMLER
jgi:HlyD family secretion protein